MPDKKVCLKAVMTIRDGKRVWSGEYACSVCDARFRPMRTILAGLLAISQSIRKSITQQKAIKWRTL